MWQGCMETTVEVSCQKWPPYDTISEFWDENRESLLSYWEMVFSGTDDIMLALTVSRRERKSY